jgi:DNA-binding response OmpR family regulator
MRVLLVEDTISLADTLVTALENANYIVDVVHDGKSGYEYAASGIYDIVVLDLMLPKMNGYEVLSKLRRENHSVPVLVLTAKSELEDKVQAFEYGTDDYLTKPFEVKELILRIAAITKRRRGSEIATLRCGNLELNVATCQMHNVANGKSIPLSGKEYHLLELLLYNKNQVLSKEQMIEKVWGYDTNAEYNSIEVYVSFLRRKMKFIGADVQIRTVRGIGYIMEEEK